MIRWFCLQNQRQCTSVSDISDGVGEPPPEATPSGMRSQGQVSWGSKMEAEGRSKC